MDEGPIVYVIDDDPSVRRALRRLIKSSGVEARTFSSAERFLKAELPDREGCLVLDVQMPGLNGLDLQQELARSTKSLPIVFISGHGSIPMSVQAMREGAVTFLTKPFDDEDLLAGIHEAIERNRSERIDRDLVDHIQERIDTLTPRELEVYTHVITGKLNKQTASDLGISEKTIKVHRARVMQKMRVKSVAELVRLAEKISLPLPN